MNKENPKKCFFHKTNFTQDILNLHRPFHTFEINNYSDEDKVFSIVRHPYEYVIGLYKQFSSIAGFPLTKDSLNTFIGLIPFIFAFCGTDLVMQSSFDTQYNKLHKNKNEMCDYILNYDNIQNEFNELMEEYGFEYRMSDNDYYNVKKSKLTRNDLSPYSKFIIRQFYRNDFVYFDFKK